MTVQTTTNVATGIGNGVTTVFPVGYKFNQDADLVVFLIETATSIATVQTLNSDYSVQGAGDDDGGSVTFLATAPATGFTVKVVRLVDLLQLTDLRNQGKFFAEVHEDVFDLLVMMIQQVDEVASNSMQLNEAGDRWNAKGHRIINVGDPIDDKDAANKLWTEQYIGAIIAAGGGPGNTASGVLYTFPNGVARTVQDLSDKDDPSLGAEGIGWRLGTVGEALDRFRYVETFGPTDTPSNTAATMQTAIDWCAANNVRLRARAPEYVIDLSAESITIPDNFRCDLDGAWIKRATGNTTPHDMWVNADIVDGNEGLDIRNVRFDGQRQADSLTNATPSHRFCGLRLVKCEGYLENIRSDNTVNGEIQVEGNRGGIMLDQSVDIKAFKLFADSTMGSGVFPYQGKNFILGVWGKDNTGSGFTSYGCDDNDFHHIYSDGSGFSGVSVNGERMRCSYLYGTNAAVGFAGVNIGHNADGNRATLSQIDNVTADGNLGWGITAIGSPLVTGDNWRADGNGVRNLFVQASAGLRVGKVVTRDAVGEDVRIEGAGDHWLSGDFRGAPFNGISLVTSGSVLHLGEETIVAECGSAGGTTGALNASAGATIICRGEVVGNLRYGAIANGAGAVVDFRGAKLDNNIAGDTLTAGGGVIRHELTRLSNDPMSGAFTIASGTSSIVVNNGNAVDASRIVIMPTDSVSAGTGTPRISALVAGASFTAQVTSAPGANATYRYALI